MRCNQQKTENRFMSQFSNLRSRESRRSCLPYCHQGVSLRSHAALDDEAVLVVCTIGVDQGLLIVLVEEVFIGQRNDLFIDPVQERLIALGDGRRDGILASERGDADGVAGILEGKSDDFGVVICPGDGISVLQGIFCIGVGVIFLLRRYYCCRSMRRNRSRSRRLPGRAQVQMSAESQIFFCSFSYFLLNR